MHASYTLSLVFFTYYFYIVLLLFCLLTSEYRIAVGKAALAANVSDAWKVTVLATLLK